MSHCHGSRRWAPLEGQAVCAKHSSPGVVESKGARLNLFKMLKSTMVRSGWGDEVTVMVQVEGLRVKALVDFGENNWPASQDS
jgi:hypothetical protein